MNVVIPMAGLGTRFSKAGYKRPKPFIDVAGIPMIERVLQNLSYHGATFILIARSEHLLQEKKLAGKLEADYRCKFISIDGVTEGAACTILLATWLINNDKPLLLANSDQIVDINIADFIEDADRRGLDGSMLTFKADHPKWSYVKIDRVGHMTELREKEVISEHATVGIYYYREGKFFVNSAVEMISQNDRVNGEFYTAPAYNYAVKAGKKIGVFGIHQRQMHGIGTPEDLVSYLKIITSR